MFKLFNKKNKKPREALGLYVAGNELLWARVMREKVSTKSGKKEEQLHVYGHGIIALPEGSVRSGMIVPSQETLQALKVLRPHASLPVAMTVPAEETVIMELDIVVSADLVPDIRDEMIRQELTSAIARTTSLSVSDAVCQYEITRMQGGSCHIVASAYRHSTVAPMIQVLQTLGFRQLTTSMMPYSIMRMHHDTDHAYLLVVMEEHGTHVALIERHTVRRMVTVPIGKKHLRDTIQSFLSTSEAQANQIMDKYGLLPTHREPALLQELTNTASPMVRHLQSLYSHWHDSRQRAGTSDLLLTDIVIAGSGAYIPGLADYLTSTLQLNTHLVDVWRLFPHMEEVIPEITWHEALRFAPAIAAAVEVVR
jgi:Tfp pilus assembly PilM family ATPase